jgi:hypothetical protein
MNQFLVVAAAEKFTAIQTAETCFAALRGRGKSGYGASIPVPIRR